MTPEEQQQVNAAAEGALKEALSAQRNEHANKEANWFAQHIASLERIKQLEAKVKELTPKPEPQEPKLEVVPTGDAA